MLYCSPSIPSQPTNDLLTDSYTHRSVDLFLSYNFLFSRPFKRLSCVWRQSIQTTRLERHGIHRLIEKLYLIYYFETNSFPLLQHQVYESLPCYLVPLHSILRPSLFHYCFYTFIPKPVKIHADYCHY